MITVKFKDEAFLDYLDRVRHGFVYMTDTMIRVAEMLKDEAQTITPIETGKLSRSFRWQIITDNSRMKVFHIEMTALNERTGYDYAFVQHRGYHTSKNGWKVYYNHGATHLGFTNYRSKIVGRGYEKSNNYDVDAYNYGDSRFLYRTMIFKEHTAFEMIETDYLSLFEFGGVYLGSLY